MNVKYIGLSEINGPLVALDHVSGISYDEMAEIKLDDGTRRLAGFRGNKRTFPC